MVRGGSIRPPAELSKEVLFVVGSGRSGTTLLYELLCSHPGAAWISNYSQRWPALSRLHPTLPSSFKGRPSRWALRPVEGYRLFDGVRPLVGAGTSMVDGPLGASNLSIGERAALRRAVATHLKASRATFFVNKNTRNTRRVGYLAAAFPEARFVHLVRHPVPTAGSLMRVPFFSGLPIFWRNGSNVRDLVAAGERPEVLAAELWARETMSCQHALSDIAHHRTLEVRYEDFVDRPLEHLDQVMGLIGGSVTPSMRAEVGARRIVNRNEPAFRDLTPEEQAAIWEVASTAAEALGYGPPQGPRTW